MIEKLDKILGPFSKWIFKGSFIGVWVKHLIFYSLISLLVFPISAMPFNIFARMVIGISAYVSLMPALISRDMRHQENMRDQEKDQETN